MLHRSRNRKNLRDVLQLKGNYIVACLLELFCCCCAVTQEWREVFERKFSDSGRSFWKAFGDNMRVLN
jgi:hypothetical protein